MKNGWKIRVREALKFMEGKFIMQTIIIVLDSKKMENPDLDIRYVLPDRIEEYTNGLIRDA